MTHAQQIQLAIDVLTAAKADLTDPATGNFKTQPDLTDDGQLLTDLESAYVKNGGTVSAELQSALAGAAAVLKLVKL